MALVLSHGGKGREAGLVEKRIGVLEGILKQVQFEEPSRNQ